MMDGTGLTGQLRLLAETTFKFRFIWATAGLVGALLAGALILTLMNRWRRSAGAEGLSANDQLSHFRELLDQGTISREEFNQIRDRLAEELRIEMNLEPPTKPVGPPPAANGTPPPELTLPQPPAKDGPPR